MCLSHLIYTVRPCLIHTCHVAPMPCSDHDVLLKATVQHDRRETACELPACVRLLPATTRSSTKIVIRSIPIFLTTIHAYDCTVWYQHTTKKDDLLNCRTSSSDISGYHADFHEGHGTVGAGQGNGMECVNAQHGRRTAWARHGHGMLCVNPPFQCRPCLPLLNRVPSLCQTQILAEIFRHCCSGASGTYHPRALYGLLRASVKQNVRVF
jgi:hypothetical protein